MLHMYTKVIDLHGMIRVQGLTLTLALTLTLNGMTRASFFSQLTLRAASKHWLVEFYEAGGLTALVMNLSDVEVIEDKTDKDVQVTSKKSVAVDNTTPDVLAGCSRRWSGVSGSKSLAPVNIFWGVNVDAQATQEVTRQELL